MENLERAIHTVWDNLKIFEIILKKIRIILIECGSFQSATATIPKTDIRQYRLNYPNCGYPAAHLPHLGALSWFWIDEKKYASISRLCECH